MTVLEALDRLRANPTQWKREYSRVYDGNGNLVAVFQSDELAGEAIHAVNHLRPLVAAFWEEHAHTGHLEPGEHGVVDLTRYAAVGCHACAALDALQRDIEVLGACSCHRVAEVSAKEWAEREPCGPNCAKEA